jgi:hypothetical protein
MRAQERPCIGLQALLIGSSILTHIHICNNRSQVAAAGRGGLEWKRLRSLQLRMTHSLNSLIQTQDHSY